MAVLGVTQSSGQCSLSQNAAAFSIDALLSTGNRSRRFRGSRQSDPEAQRNNRKTRGSDDEPEEEVACGEEETVDVSGYSQEIPLIRANVLPLAGQESNQRLEEDCMQGVTCKLETSELWKKFYDLGTEMIITKTGRRMFPTLRVSFSGLRDHCHYDIYMDIIPVDSKRYRYAYHRSSWLVAGKGDPAQSTRPHRHHDSPASGSSLSRQTVSFEKIKLTNNNIHKNDHVSVDKDWSGGEISELFRRCPHKSFVFAETTFIAVTAYQNQLITKLKIDSNPFAKGFRDSSRLSDMERETMEGMLGGLPKSSYLELHAQLAAAAKFVNAQALHQTHATHATHTAPMFPVPHHHHVIAYPSINPRLKFDDGSYRRSDRWMKVDTETSYPPKQVKAPPTIRFKPYESR